MIFPSSPHRPVEPVARYTPKHRFAAKRCNPAGDHPAAGHVLSFAHMNVARGKTKKRVRRGGQGRARVAAALFGHPIAEGAAPDPGVPGGPLRHHLLPLALYLLITGVATFPLLLHFGTHLPGDGRDAWQNYWDYWWLRTALAEGHNPYQTPLLYAPYGAPLYLHTLNPFNGLITLPIQIAFGLTAAYNTVVFLSLTLAAYFAYLLVTFVGGSRLAGFVGGAIYAFGSYHLAHLLGHANLLASEWLPAYILCLLAAGTQAGRRRALLIGAGVGALLLLTFCEWQYVLFAGLFTALYALYTAVARRSLTPLVVAGMIGACWLVLALPILLPTARAVRDTAGSRAVVLGPAQFSADLLSLVVPSPLQAWWGPAAERLGGKAVAPLVERAVFLGYLPLALAGIGLWFGRRRAAFWALAALAFAILALGPTLQIAGQTPGNIPLPYRLLEQIPGVNVSRVPARYALLVTLCLAVLSGLGFAALAGRFARPGRSPALLAATALLVAALLAEHVAAPYPLVAVEEPPFYRQLAADREAGAVLELPLVMTRASSLFGQTVHRKPIVGGYLSRQLDYPLLALPPFAATTADSPAGDIVPPTDSNMGSWMLRLATVRWIVVLLDDPKLNRDEIAAFLRDYAEPTPLYTDARMAVYRPKPTGPPTFLLHPAEGWHLPEALPDKRRMRWLPWSADLDAWSLGDGPQAGTLSFEAWSFNQPRHLAVSVDGRPVGEWLVAEPRRIAIPVTLDPGQHRVEFRTLDPPERPARTVGGEDTRLISIGVTGIALQPAVASAAAPSR